MSILHLPWPLRDLVRRLACSALHGDITSRWMHHSTLLERRAHRAFGGTTEDVVQISAHQCPLCGSLRTRRIVLVEDVPPATALRHMHCPARRVAGGDQQVANIWVTLQSALAHAAQDKD